MIGFKWLLIKLNKIRDAFNLGISMIPPPNHRKYIWDFLLYFYRYGHQYLTYLPWKFLSKLYFWQKYGSKIPYLPTVWTYVQTFVVFFIGPFPNSVWKAKQVYSIDTIYPPARPLDISQVFLNWILMVWKQVSLLSRVYSII